MMINEYDHVVIKSSKISGIVIDVFEKDGKTLYTVESDEKGVQGGAGEIDEWKRFICAAEELEKV